MIIGAQSINFPSIIDAAPPSFGVFYWESNEDPLIKCFATITKLEPGYCYEFRMGNALPDLVTFEHKEVLVARMEADNQKYNGGLKCTVEF